MSLPAWITTQKDGVYLTVKVQPRASKNAIAEPLGSELKIKITAPPVDSAANEALVRFLAETLGCSRGAVQLVRGQTARHKVLRIQGLAAEEIVARLL